MPACSLPLQTDEITRFRYKAFAFRMAGIRVHRLRVSRPGTSSEECGYRGSSVPNRSVSHWFEPRGAGADAREIVAAWIVAVLLLLGTAVSVVFDHLVTVTDPAAPAGMEEQRDSGSNDGRELRDPDSAFGRLR